jgi:hypothetical protein
MSQPKTPTKKTLTKPTTLRWSRKRIGRDDRGGLVVVAVRLAARKKSPTTLQKLRSLQKKSDWTTTTATTNRRRRVFAVNVSRLRAGKPRSPTLCRRT